MNTVNLTGIGQFQEFVNESEACLIYFSHENCTVCKALKPKILELCDLHFPKLRTAFADTELYPEIAGQNGVFAVPVILVFFEGREYIRAARNVSVPEFSNQLKRYYQMIF